MRYTKSALGFLNAQYRSVLKKCFLINTGLFFVVSPVLAETITCDGNSRCVVESGNDANLDGKSFSGLSPADDASNKNGGAILNEGTVSGTIGSLTNNKTNDGSGGAIYNTGSAITIGGDITGNSAGTNGGAIYSTKDVTITGASDITGNSAGSGHGGAVYMDGGNLTLNVTNELKIGNSGNHNTANGKNEAVYMNGGTLNINLTRDVHLHDLITGATTTNITSSSGSRRFYLYNESSSNDVGITDSNINVGSYVYFDTRYDNRDGVYKFGDLTLGDGRFYMSALSTGSSDVIQTGIFTGVFNSSHFSFDTPSVGESGSWQWTILKTGGGSWSASGEGGWNSYEQQVGGSVKLENVDNTITWMSDYDPDTAEYTQRELGYESAIKKKIYLSKVSYLKQGDNGVYKLEKKVEDREDKGDKTADALWVATTLSPNVTCDLSSCTFSDSGAPVSRSFISQNADEVYAYNSSKARYDIFGGLYYGQLPIHGTSFDIEGKWGKDSSGNIFLSTINGAGGFYIDKNSTSGSYRETFADTLTVKNVVFQNATNLFEFRTTKKSADKTITFTNVRLLPTSGYAIQSKTDFKIVADGTDLGDITTDDDVEGVVASTVIGSVGNSAFGIVIGQTGTEGSDAAGYVGISDVNVTFNAVNGGEIYLNQSISGVNGYKVIISGNDAKTEKFHLNGQIKWDYASASDARLNQGEINIDKITVSMLGNAVSYDGISGMYTEYKFAGGDGTIPEGYRKLISTENARYEIDLSLGKSAAETSGSTYWWDRIVAQSADAGQYITLSKINFNDFSVDAYNSLKESGKKLQIVKNMNNKDNIQLRLEEEDGSPVEGLLFPVSSIIGAPYTDSVKSETNWAENYTRGKMTEIVNGTVKLATKDTTNDSLVITEGPTTYSKDIEAGLGDNLVMVNRLNGTAAGFSSRSFDFGSFNNVKVVNNDKIVVEETEYVSDLAGQNYMGTTGAGKFVINGKSNSGGTKSTIDLNQYTGFVSGNGAEYDINNVLFTNGVNAFTFADANSIQNFTNVDFKGNLSARADEEGSAIYANKDVNLYVTGTTVTDPDSGETTDVGYTSVIKDNSGNSAVYMDGSNLNIGLSKAGVFELDDVINGTNNYAVNVGITDGSTGTFLLAGEMKDAIVTFGGGSSGTLTVNTLDNTTRDNAFKTLFSNIGTDVAKYEIDINYVTLQSDTFTTTDDYGTSTGTASNGTVLLNKLNILNSGSEFIADADVGDTYKIKVLNNANNNNALQLSMTDELREQTSVEKQVGLTEKEVSDAIKISTAWNDKYAVYNQKFGVNGILEIGTKDTANDSIVLKVTSLTPGEKTFIGYQGDTLALVNQANLGAEKEFYFNRYNNIYKVEDNLGSSSTDTFNVKGVLSSSADKASSINMNSHSGFVLNNISTLNISNVDIKNASGIDGSAIKVVNSSAKVNLTNVNLYDNNATGSGGAIYNKGTVNVMADDRDVSFEGNMVNEAANAIYNAGILNFTTTNGNKIVLADGINGDNGIINIAGDVTLKNSITDNRINLNSGNLKADESSATFGTSDSLYATGGSLTIGTNTVNLNSVVFNSGSVLDLKIRAVTDGRHGLVVADNMVVNEGAVLKATLGTGLLGGKPSVEVRLLSAGNDDFVNNFADVVNNNMYKISKKAGEEGVYIIQYYKTAEEVSRENGGTEDNALTARNWVDLSPFDDGTVGQSIADGLFELAQNDGKKLNEALAAIAPSEAPMVKTAAITNSDRLFNMIGTHLRNNRVIQRNRSMFGRYMNSGYYQYNNTYDSYQDSYGTRYYGVSSGDNSLKYSTTWAKAYFSKGNYDDDGAVSGFDLDAKGMAIGADTNLGESVRVGIGYAFDLSTAENSSRDTDITTHTGFVYGEVKPNRWFANLMASYSMSEYEEDKKALGKKFKAKYDVKYSSVQFKTGYEFIGHYINYIPEFGARVTSISRDAYTDDTTQHVDSADMKVVTGLAGLRMNKSYRVGDSAIVRPEAYLGVGYDMKSDDEKSVIQLKNGRSYTFVTSNTDKFSLEGNLGLNIKMNEKFDINMTYIGNWRGKYTEHTGTVGAKYRF